MNNHYQVLGVSESATPEILKIAFEGKLKALAKATLSDAERKEEERALRYAYGVVSNPARRATYDAELEGAVDRDGKRARTRMIAVAAGVVVVLVGSVMWVMAARTSKLEGIRLEEARIAREAEDLRRQVAFDKAEKERRDQEDSYIAAGAQRREVDYRKRVERERAGYQRESDRAAAMEERERRASAYYDERAASERQREETRNRTEAERDRRSAVQDVERQKRYLQDREREEERARAERHERAVRAAEDARRRDADLARAEREAESARQRAEEAYKRQYYPR